MRPTRPAAEPRRHTRTSQRVFEQTEVAVRRSHENRHLIEAAAAARFAQDAPGDLDRLASFTWRREQRE